MHVLGTCGVGATPAIPTNVSAVDVAASVSEQTTTAFICLLTLAATGISFPFSSIVERPAVNRDDAGANPATGAI